MAVLEEVEGYTESEASYLLSLLPVPLSSEWVAIPDSIMFQILHSLLTARMADLRHSTIRPPVPLVAKEVGRLYPTL
jgi:hypothetical protein